MGNNLLIKDISIITSGSSAPKEQDFSESGLPFFRAGHLEGLINHIDLDTLPKVDDVTAKKLKLTKVTEGTILFAKSGMSAKKNRIYKCEKEAYIVNHLAAIIPNTSIIDSSYLRYFFQWFGPSRLIVDESYPSIRISDIGEIEIRIPIMEKQKKIVLILDQSQSLIEKRKSQIQALDELTQSVLLEMFGDIKSNSKNWEIKKIGDVVESITSGWSVGGDERIKRKGELGVLKISAVTSGTFNPREYKVINKNVEIKKAIHPKKGDILFSRANTRELVGASAIVDKDYVDLIIPDKLWKIEIKKELTKEYFKAILSNIVIRNEISKNATGTSGSMLNISMEKFRGISIPIPPLYLQEKFSNILSKIYSQKTVMKKSLLELEHNFNSLMQRAFKGELFND